MWETKTELNVSSFVLERSHDQKSWNCIGTVTAKGTSTEPSKYSFIDKNLNSGKLYYRLRIVDLDRSENFSTVIESEITIPRIYSLSQNYPNPFNPSTKIQYQIPAAANVTIEIFSITGETTIQPLKNVEQEAGYYTLEINAAGKFTSGVYIIRMIAVDKLNGNSFTSAKKMIYLK